MESAITPAPRQTPALLNPVFQESFSHLRSSSDLAQPRGLALLLHQPGPGMDGGEQLCQLPLAHSHRGDGHRGGLATLDSALSPVCVGIRGQLHVPADLPNSWPRLFCQHPRQDWSPRLSSLSESVVTSGVLSVLLSQGSSMVGNTTLGTGSSSILCCSPALGHLSPRCHVKSRSKACPSACILPLVCPILLPWCSTAARNKGLSSTLTHQRPGSTPQRVRAGFRVRG